MLQFSYYIENAPGICVTNDFVSVLMPLVFYVLIITLKLFNYRPYQ